MRGNAAARHIILRISVGRAENRWKEVAAAARSSARSFAQVVKVLTRRSRTSIFWLQAAFEESRTVRSRTNKYAPN